MGHSNPVTSSQRDTRRFYSSMAISMAIVVFAGFARTFYLRMFFPEAIEMAAPEPIFYVHGSVFTAWICFLVAQTLFIRNRKIALHRSLGWFGAGLAVAVVLLGIYGSLVAAQRPGGFIGVPLPPLQFLAIPLFDIVLFGLFVGLAVAWRQNAASHKRLMMLATINLIEAAIIRIPIDFIIAGAPFASRGLSYIFIIALVIRDLRTTGRVHRVTLWGGLIIVVSFPVRMLISQTQTWVGFAGWAVGLTG